METASRGHQRHQQVHVDPVGARVASGDDQRVAAVAHGGDSTLVAQLWCLGIERRCKQANQRHLWHIRGRLNTTACLLVEEPDGGMANDERKRAAAHSRTRRDVPGMGHRQKSMHKR